MIQILKTYGFPIAGLIVFYVVHHSTHPILLGAAVIFLIVAILQAVEYAEVIAHKVGEPFGTVILAIAVTLIEVSIIATLMLSNSEENSSVARDTVFAAVMIIVNAMIGIITLVGSLKFGEQSFSVKGISASLTVLIVISSLTLILPNFTLSVSGPFYNTKQLLFVAISTLILYGAFLFIQNFRHKEFFILEEELQEETHEVNNNTFVKSIILLLINLVVVVLLAESIAPWIDQALISIGAPIQLTGVVIAGLILLPEGISALAATNKNNVQKSFNLALGSALATLGLTIPTLAFVSIATGLPLTLGITNEFIVLYVLSLLVMTLNVISGKSSILQGIVHIVLFFTYLLLIIVP
ncbi:MAG: ionic transporter y4hA [Cytophagaceae bacterium]|nr:ionic transporter y4hA [Cytophagaceae bacterium]